LTVDTGGVCKNRTLILRIDNIVCLVQAYTYQVTVSVLYFGRIRIKTSYNLVVTADVKVCKI